MKIEFSVQASGNVIYKNVYPYNFDGEHDIEEAAVEIKTENSILSLKEMWFEGIHISTVEIDAGQTEDLFFESSHQHIAFLFCLSGSLNYCCYAHQNFLSLSKNEQNINLGKVDNITFRINEKTSYVYVQLTQAYFYKVMGHEFRHDFPASAKEPISTETGLILQHFISHKHRGRVRRLFLEARIFDLIIGYINQEQEKQAVILKEEDVNKIIYAKQLVENDLQKPNSLMELSRKAGINDYKLKKGFKALTGHTVFGYLYKIRMEKAHYFLSKEKKTVNEVAFLVGYKNAQHFIAAFKKQYQILPGSLNKN